MFACTDVDYRTDATGDYAIAACVVFKDWTDATPCAEYTSRIAPIADYVSGEFYRRELPCLLDVLRRVPDRIGTLVIDGYVWLDGRAKKGLGAHLYDALNASTPIIGVAKTPFKTADVEAVVRGIGRTPLYITSEGTDRSRAADFIRSMHGPHRIPTLLKRVDTLSRTAI